MSANRALAPKPWPLSRIARRMLALTPCSLQGHERLFVLPGGLADRGAHHYLEGLVLAEARAAGGGDVRVGDLARVLGDLADQRVQRLGESRVVERRTTLGA